MRNPLSKLFRRYTNKVGLPPGTLVYVGEERTELVQINLIDYNESYFEESKVETFEECLNVNNPETVTWLHIQGIHQANFISEFGEYFGVNSLVLEDVMNPIQLPKIEVFENYVFVILKALDYTPETSMIIKEQVSLIIGNDFVVSFQENVDELFKSVQNRLRNGQGRIRKMQSAYLAYTLIDVIVDNYFIMLEQLNEEIQLLEEEVIANPVPDVLKKVNNLKRQVFSLRRPILPLRDVLDEVLDDEIPIFSQETQIFFRDVYDHVIQVTHTLEMLNTTVSGLYDTYRSTVNHKMNEVMKVLTIVATFFIPLTFIAGIYGMNFKFMPELDTQWGYPFVLLVMVAIGITMFSFFKRKKWF